MVAKAACIEQNYDEDGIVFPPAIAPYEVALLVLDPKNEQVMSQAEFYAALDEPRRRGAHGRPRTSGPREFKDADLMGLPMQLTLGGKGWRGVVEAKNRRAKEKTELALVDFDAAFAEGAEGVRRGWGLRGGRPGGRRWRARARHGRGLRALSPDLPAAVRIAIVGRKSHNPLGNQCASQYQQAVAGKNEAAASRFLKQRGQT